jgi:hypothetical protein
LIRQSREKSAGTGKRKVSIYFRFPIFFRENRWILLNLQTDLENRGNLYLVKDRGRILLIICFIDNFLEKGYTTNA